MHTHHEHKHTEGKIRVGDSLRYREEQLAHFFFQTLLKYLGDRVSWLVTRIFPILQLIIVVSTSLFLKLMENIQNL